MDELLDRSEQVRRCLDMNDAATVRESVDSLNNRLQQVSSQAQARQRQVAAYKHDWLTYQVSQVTLAATSNETAIGTVGYTCRVRIVRQSCGLQDQLETTEDMLTQLNSTWQSLAADDSDVTSLAYSCQQLQSLHDFRQQLADSEHHVTSLAAQAQQLQATADAASGDVIRARAADVEERWLKLTQAVEETEQEAQVSADVTSTSTRTSPSRRRNGTVQ